MWFNMMCWLQAEYIIMWTRARVVILKNELRLHNVWCAVDKQWSKIYTDDNDCGLPSLYLSLSLGLFFNDKLLIHDVV